MVSLPLDTQPVKALLKGLEVWPIFALELFLEESLGTLYLFDLCDKVKYDGYLM